MRELIKNERGAFMFIEAAIIYPMMLIMIMLLLFISMMFTMKANMQSALETALMYYRTELTDTYVGFIGDIDKNSVSNTGYTQMTAPESYSNIYVDIFREMTAKPDTEKFKKMFMNNYKFLNFSSGEGGGMFTESGINVSLESSGNFIIYRELSATATQEIKLPFVNGIFGLDNTMRLKADAKIVVSDNVSVMRVTDVVDYVIIKTGLDEKLDSIFGDNVQKFLDFISGSDS